jgi:hypothetical protein
MAEKKKASAMDELKHLELEVGERRAALKVQAARSKGPVSLELTEPITIGGEARARLSVRPHTVKDMKLAEEEREGWSVRLAGMLTSLTPDEVGLLAMADWDAVQAIVEGFQMRRGAGSPALST